MASHNVTLDRKYFIVQTPVPSGGAALSRGQVIGVINDIYPYYLVKLTPFDSTTLHVDTEVILSLEDLKGAYFYSDELIWREEWLEIGRRIDEQRRKAEAAAKARERAAKKRAQNPPPEIVAMVPSSFAELADVLERLNNLPVAVDETDEPDEPAK